MNREPSIHITQSDLSKILKTHVFKEDISCDEMAKNILMWARAYSINTRTITTTNDRIEKKVTKLIQSSRRDADLLAQLICATRKRLKHRGITPIKAGSRDWGILKEVTAHALDFVNEFGLSRRGGFLKYLEIGMSKMQKFAINKFLGMYSGICETYQAMLEIEQDDDSQMTSEMYSLYARRVLENTGIHDPLEQMPEKYVWFVRARQQAKQLNISVSIYIKAQFKGLDFSKGIPHPTQLVGPKATERVVRYCYEEGIKVNKK